MKLFTVSWSAARWVASVSRSAPARGSYGRPSTRRCRRPAAPAPPPRAARRAVGAARRDPAPAPSSPGAGFWAAAPCPTSPSCHPVLYVVKRRGQLLLRDPQPRLDGAERLVEPPGDLAVRQAIEVRQHHDPALLLGQRRERGLHLPGHRPPRHRRLLGCRPGT